MKGGTNKIMKKKLSEQTKQTKGLKRYIKK